MVSSGRTIWQVQVGCLLGWPDAVREGGDALGELLIGAFSIKLKQGSLLWQQRRKGEKEKK
jgi:hypothetical protein